MSSAKDSRMLLRRGSIPMQREDLQLNEFEVIGKPLGCGAFGYVNKVMHKTTGFVYAMKVMSKAKIVEHSLLANIEREISTQQTVCHPNILRLYKCFEDADDINLLLEFAQHGSLFDVLKARRKQAGSDEALRGLPQEQAAGVFRDVAKALDYLHKEGLMHRDLKPENILVCEGGVIKLADFGWCNQLAADDQGRSTFCGTWEYLSPEMIANEPYNFSVDVWAIGVLLFEMLAGRSPFAAKNYVQALTKISSVAYEFPSFFSLAAKDLIRALLVKNPAERLSLEKAVRHPWVLSHAQADEQEDTDSDDSLLCEDDSGSKPESKEVLVYHESIPQSSAGFSNSVRRMHSVQAEDDRSDTKSVLELVASARSPRKSEDDPIRLQQEARVSLKRALEGCNVNLLESALTKAAAAGLDEGELDAARRALTEEQGKAEIRRRLMDATRRRSKPDMLEALKEAEQLVGCKDREIVEHASHVLSSLDTGSEGSGDDYHPSHRVPERPEYMASVSSDAALTQPAGSSGSCVGRQPLPLATTNLLEVLRPTSSPRGAEKKSNRLAGLRAQIAVDGDSRLSVDSAGTTDIPGQVTPGASGDKWRRKSRILSRRQSDPAIGGLSSDPGGQEPHGPQPLDMSFLEGNGPQSGLTQAQLDVLAVRDDLGHAAPSCALGGSLPLTSMGSSPRNARESTGAWSNSSGEKSPKAGQGLRERLASRKKQLKLGGKQGNDPMSLSSTVSSVCMDDVGFFKKDSPAAGPVGILTCPILPQHTVFDPPSRLSDVAVPQQGYKDWSEPSPRPLELPCPPAHRGVSIPNSQEDLAAVMDCGHPDLLEES